MKQNQTASFLLAFGNQQKLCLQYTPFHELNVSFCSGTIDSKSCCDAAPRQETDFFYHYIIA